MIDLQKIDAVLIDHWMQPAVDRLEPAIGVNRHDLAMTVLVLDAILMLFTGAVRAPTTALAAVTDAVNFGNLCAFVWIGWLVWRYRRIDGAKAPGLAPRSRLELASVRRFLLLFLPLTVIPMGPPTAACLALTIVIGLCAILPFWVIACRAAPPSRPSLIDKARTVEAAS